MTKTETLNLRVSPEFKRKLAEEAAKEKRSVTNYVEATLTTIWDRTETGRSRSKKPKPSANVQ
jgi:predicted HicB family RNase H-like nuclease